MCLHSSTTSSHPPLGLGSLLNMGMVSTLENPGLEKCQQQPHTSARPLGNPRSPFTNSPSQTTVHHTLATSAINEQDEDEASQSTSSSDSPRSTYDKRSPKVSHKKKRNSDNIGGSDENEQLESKELKRIHKGKPIETPRLLACPYFKMDPTTFSKSKACVGPGWRTAYRLK